jgi:hypothetical protein
MIDDDIDVLKRILTGDENWCFMYDPEKKSESTLVDFKETDSSEIENAKISDENKVDCIYLC